MSVIFSHIIIIIARRPRRYYFRFDVNFLFHICTGRPRYLIYLVYFNLYENFERKKNI